MLFESAGLARIFQIRLNKSIEIIGLLRALIVSKAYP